MQGTPRNGLARINADGSLDPAFDAQLNDGARVDAIGVQDGDTILIGGTLTSVGGVARELVAGLQNDGTLDPQFAPTLGATGNNAVVRTIRPLSGGQWLIAGSFDAWNGVRRWGVARINADGSLDSSFDPGSATPGFRVDAADVAASGLVAVAGARMSGTLARSVIEMDSSGTLRFARDVAGYSPSTVVGEYQEAPALLLEADGSALVGLESSDGLHPTSGSAYRIHSDGTLDHRFAPEFGSSNAHFFARGTGDTVIMGGNFVGADAMAYAGLLRLVPETAPSRLANISTRGYVGANNETLIAGFFISGSEPQRVLIRGVARNLESFGITNHASQPSIYLFRQGESAPFAENHNWYYGLAAGWGNTPAESARIASQAERLGAFPLEVIAISLGQQTSYDSALLLDLPPGGYTVQLQADTPGLGLVEVYDANGVGADRKVINISTRGRVGTGDERMIAGFVIGEGTKRVLIRAAGPAIAGAVAGTLVDPRLELVRQSDGTVIETNDNWGDNANAAALAAASLQVSGLQLADGSADAALLVDLPVGGYTVIVSGVGETSGIALAEVYEVE